MAKLVSANLAGDKLCMLTYTTTDGEMLSFSEDAFDAKIISHSYVDKGEIVFSEPISQIGVFWGRVSLTSINIPDSVTEIKYAAFKDCTSLTNVTIGNSVTSIEDEAFSGCTQLTNINLPDSVTEIGNWAFANCASLTRVTIPDNVTEIGNYTFFGCSSLTTFSGKFATEDGRSLILNML